MKSQKEHLQELKVLIKKYGFLMLSDNELPAIIQTMAGQPIAGSWWGHPLGNLMYNTSQELADQKNILVIKLINNKITYLEMAYWESLFKILLAPKYCETKIPKIKSLKKVHLELLKLVNTKKIFKIENAMFQLSPTEIGKLANKLEENLLCYSTSEHTKSGKHIRILKSWPQIYKELKQQNPNFIKSKKVISKILDNYPNAKISF